jgi:hypothetical protein
VYGGHAVDVLQGIDSGTVAIDETGSPFSVPTGRKWRRT